MRRCVLVQDGRRPTRGSHREGDDVRVAVVGAGAMGGVLAGAAAEAGHDVTLRVRTPFDALVIVRDGVEVTVPATISAAPSGPPADVVFLVVKATDTASVAAHLAELCGSATRTVVVQNGVGHEERVAPFLPPGAGPIVPAVIYAAAERVAPGRIHHIHGESARGAGRARAPMVTDAVAPGVRVRGTDDFVTEAWRKLFANLVGNPITAITLRHMDVMRSPGMRRPRAQRPRRGARSGAGRGRTAHRRRRRSGGGRRRALRSRDRQLDAVRPAGRSAHGARVPHRRGRPPRRGPRHPGPGERRRSSRCWPRSTTVLEVAILYVV